MNGDDVGVILEAQNCPSADGKCVTAFAVEQYRAFCLLALGRGKEAQSAIENLVVANPLYQPSSTEVSPRVRTAFSACRGSGKTTLVSDVCIITAPPDPSS